MKTIYDYDAEEVEKYYLDRTLLYNSEFKTRLHRFSPEVIDRLLRYGYYWHTELKWEDWKIHSELVNNMINLTPREKIQKI